MSNKAFIGIIVTLLVAGGAYIFITQKNKPKEVILGVSHTNQGQNHIAQGEKHDPYNSDPASSGPHYSANTAPTPWGVYVQEVPEEVFVHNEEHGGVVITYRPDLSADQLKKLQALFAPPYSNSSFKPNKAVVAPRSKNTHAIELAAWTWTLNLDSYDEATITKFYLQHVGKAPEVGAGPNNAPINQAAGQ